MRQPEVTEKETIRFTKIGEKETRVEMVIELDLSKNVSSGAVKDCLKRHLEKVTKAVFYFNNLLEGEELKEEDGKVIGEQLMLSVKEKEKGKEQGGGSNGLHQGEQGTEGVGREVHFL